MKKHTVQACYLAALKQFFEKGNCMTFQELIENTRIPENILFDILVENKEISDDIKDKISRAISIPVADMLLTGSFYLETGVYFPYFHVLHSFLPHSSERAARIIELVASEFNLKLGYVPVKIIPYLIQIRSEDYIKNRMNEADFILSCRYFFKKALAYYLN